MNVLSLVPVGSVDAGPLYGQAHIPISYPIKLRTAYELLADAYPRPINGIFVAITVMNCTFASSGRLAM